MNTKATHTPGPWEAEGDYVFAPIVGYDARIARVTDIDSEANARLIAAAPDLLEALREAVGWMQHVPGIADSVGQIILDDARAAIAKARGEA